MTPASSPTGDTAAALPELAIEAGYLVELTGEHTCGADPNGYYGAHEPGCGMEPVMPVAELRELIRGHSTRLVRLHAAAAALVALADDPLVCDPGPRWTAAVDDLRAALLGNTVSAPSSSSPDDTAPGTFLTGSEAEALDGPDDGRVRVRLTELERRGAASLTLTMTPLVACELVDAVVSALDASNSLIPGELARLRKLEGPDRVTVTREFLATARLDTIRHAAVSSSSPDDTAGRCGDTGELLFGKTFCCELRAGHAGWHREGVTEWSGVVARRAAASADVPVTAPAPGVDRIAQAIETACEVADMDIEVAQDGYTRLDPYRLLAKVLDKAGLINWSAFVAPVPADGDTEETR